MQDLLADGFSIGPNPEAGSVGFTAPTAETANRGLHSSHGIRSRSKAQNKSQSRNSSKRSSQAKSQRNNHQTQVSLMLGDISTFSCMQPDNNLMHTIDRLQIALSQELLALREDKITLMSAYNHTIGGRYALERELHQLRAKGMPTDNDSIEAETMKSQSPRLMYSSQHDTIDRNVRLKQEYQAVLSGQKQQGSTGMSPRGEEDVLNQIEQLVQGSTQIELMLTKTDTQQLRAESTSILRTRDRRERLLREIVERGGQREGGQLLAALDQNYFLIQKYHAVVASHLGSPLDSLRSRISQEQKSKYLFFQELQDFKQRSNALKRENQWLRQQLQC